MQFPLPGGPLRAAEVRELWAFLHGDVMVPGIRRSLREGLGLCPRHTWCYAIVEIELWLTGGGVRGGHQPFDVCVLYEDLLAAAIDRLERRRLPRRGHVARVLEPRASCRVCATLTGPGGAQSVPSYAAAQTIALTAEANRLRYTVAWCRETVDVWRDRICPACASAYTDRHRRADVIASTATGLLCRHHLQTVPAPQPRATAAVAPCLRLLRRDLLALLHSMATGAGAPTAQQNASWVETLSWFAGWELPLTVVQADW